MSIPHNVQPLIVGAFARDLHLRYGHGIAVLRKTEDVDCAVAVPDWPVYQAIKSALFATGHFTQRAGMEHALNYKGLLPLDLLPFGALETPHRQIAWPPNGEVQMSVFGFQEANRTAALVVLPQSVQVNVVSLAGLALLKLNAWQDAGAARGGRDATDLYAIASNYAVAGNQHRLFDQHALWFVEPEADYVMLGARLLGADLRALLSAKDVAWLHRHLAREADEQGEGKLAVAMHRDDPEKARKLLAAMLVGCAD